MSDEQNAAREAELKAKQDAADAENKTRAGVGTRKRVGQTRGKGSQVVTWEAFDESLPDTLPQDEEQFMSVTGIRDRKTLLSFWISGYNDAQYVAASDPIAEFIEPTWDDAKAAQFRLVVRNYARGAEKSIEDAVALIKPGFMAQ